MNLRFLCPAGPRLHDIQQSLHHLHRKVNAIMATQEQLDTIVTRIDTAVTGIRADIEQIKTDNPQLDLSSLEAKVAALESLDAENPQPAPAQDDDTQIPGEFPTSPDTTNP